MLGRARFPDQPPSHEGEGVMRLATGIVGGA